MRRMRLYYAESQILRTKETIMFNLMKRRIITKVERNSIVLAVLTTALLLGASCGGSSSSTSGGGASANSAAGGRQIVISGDINKTYTPQEITAAKIADYVGVTMIEEFPCGVELRFRIDKQPGTYAIEDHLRQPVVEVLGLYSPDCGKSGYYMSTQGTLKLTESGKKYSGTFEFTAALNRDHSKTIKVSGSFSDASLP